MAGFRRFRTLNDLRAGPCCLSAFQKLIAKFETTDYVMDIKKSGRLSVIIDIVVAKILQETQDLAHENEYGTYSVNKIAGRLKLSRTPV